MAKASIDVVIDFKKAIAEAKAGGIDIAKAISSSMPEVKLPNLGPQVQRNIVAPSGNARMAMTSLSQTVQDSTTFMIGGWRMLAMSVGNNVDQMVTNLVNLNAETKRNGTSMGKELLNVIKGPSGILFGISLLIAALQVIPYFVGQTDAAMEKAAEGGMKKYAERLVDLGTGDIAEVGKRIEAQRKALLEEQKKYVSVTSIPDPLTGMPVLTSVYSNKARYDEIQKQIEILDKFNSKNKESITEANELQAVLGLAGGVLGARPFSRQQRDAQIAAMKEGIDKEKKLADQKLEDDITRTKKEISNIKARDSIIEDLRKAHANKIKEIEKPLRDAEVLQSGKSLSEQFKALGMSGADLDRVMKYDRSGAVNQLAELQRIKDMVAGSALSGDKKFSVMKDIENEIEAVKRKKIDADIEVQQLKIDLINDDEAREIESIRLKYKEKIDNAALEKKSAEEIWLLTQARDAEVDRKREDYLKNRKDAEEKAERDLSTVRQFDAENELQQKLSHIHIEYEKRKEIVEDLRRDNRISIEEEQQLLRGLANAETRDKTRASKQFHENERREWAEDHQTAMVGINSLNAGISTMIGSFISKQRQAKDEWDASWLAMKNTALSALSDVIAEYIKIAIINAFIKGGTAIATGGASLIPSLAIDPGFTGSSGTIARTLDTVARPGINIEAYTERARIASGNLSSFSSSSMRGVEQRLDALVSTVDKLKLTAQIDRRGLAFHVAKGSEENNQVIF